MIVTHKFEYIYVRTLIFYCPAANVYILGEHHSKIGELRKDNSMQSRVIDLGQKWVKLAQNCTNPRLFLKIRFQQFILTRFGHKVGCQKDPMGDKSGSFSDEISVPFGSVSQNVLIFHLFWVNLTQIRAKPDILKVLSGSAAQVVGFVTVWNQPTEWVKMWRYGGGDKPSSPLSETSHLSIISPSSHDKSILSGHGYFFTIYNREKIIEMQAILDSMFAVIRHGGIDT